MIAASAMSVAPRWPFDEWTSIFGSACSRTAVSHRLCTNNGNFVAESSSSKSEWIVREVGVALRAGHGLQAGEDYAAHCDIGS
jgi:hypothetical protein